MCPFFVQQFMQLCRMCTTFAVEDFNTVKYTVGTKKLF